MARSVLVALALLAACERPPDAKPQPTSDPPNRTTTPTTPPQPGVVTAVWAGARRNCVARDGAVRCWGNAYNNSLGPGVSMTMTSVPTPLPGLEGATSVALGESHGCAVMPDSTVRCWGANDHGALGNNGAGEHAPTPIPVPAITSATAVVAAEYRTCALASGAAWCWGEGFAKLPLPVAGVTDALQLALGSHHACARTPRDVVCWGENQHGQLGQPGEAASATPTAVPGLGAVDEIAAAGDYTCARTGGAVRCWGEGEDAQLGQPDRKDSPTPLAIPGLGDAVALALGPGHACALRTNGLVSCWGGSDRSSFGFPDACPKDQVGQSHHAGTSGVVMAYCAAPMPVAGISDAVALVHGLGHACALGRAGGLRCWGGTGYGELGNRDHGAAASEAPLDVTFPEPNTPTSTARATAVTASGEWSCAVLTDRTVRCWGAGTLGMLGPNFKGVSATPVTIPGVEKVVSLAQGAYHACALVDGGGVRCWGHNRSGALGDGTDEAHTTPVTPIGLPAVTQLSAAADAMGGHTCALTKDGAVWCWGGNRAGQAAPGGPLAALPAAIPGITDAKQVVAGQGATCVVQQGVPHCWGELPSATGRGIVEKPTPIALDRVVELGMGYQVICGRRDDGTVACWGKRRDNTIKTVEVPLGGKARAIAVGNYGAVALRTDGKVFNWWIEEDSAPTELSLDAPTQVATSGSHTCALAGEGHVLCWGGNQNGQLGNPDQGAGGESKTPTRVAL